MRNILNINAGRVMAGSGAVSLSIPPGELYHEIRVSINVPEIKPAPVWADVFRMKPLAMAVAVAGGYL